MSKNKIIEDLMKITNIPRDSLRRMTIYDLNNLTKSLNGEKINAPKLNGIEKKPLRKRVVKNRKLKDDDPVISDDDFFDDDNENENDNENDNENEEQAEKKPDIKPEETKEDIKENLVNEIVEIPKPSKLTRDVDEKEIVENEIVENKVEKPKPEKAKDKPKPKPKKKIINEKTEVKPVIDKFQKSLTKLITQYKRVRTPNQNHKDKLINFYNKEYDEITAEIEQILEKYMFIDDDIYEWVNDLLTGQKMRLIKLIGD